MAIGDGRAAAARVGDEVVAFENRCLHQASPLAGGMVREGVLTCPLHFWRYRLPDGVKVGDEEHRLTRYPVSIEGGVVFADVPDPEPPRSMRDLLLDHARTWDRGDP
jgi:nitrite reductase/ring-hydroxylating ferredoxin subunit